MEIRPARESDSSFFRGLRNEPETVAASLSPHPVPADEHAEWFKTKLQDPDSHLFVISESGDPRGYLRVDRRGDVGIVSIALTSGSRSRGLGRNVLLWASEEMSSWGLTKLSATIKDWNLASKKAFAAAGFRLEEGTVPGVELWSVTKRDPI